MPQRYHRILVIGISGAGKTTLALRIAAATRLPLIHLDREHWLPGWIEPAKADWRAKVQVLAAAEEWVMDGNFTGTFELRMRRADAIVWLDYAPLKCIVRVLRRVIGSWGRTGPDMANGCPEHFDRKFLAYIWRFPRTHRPIVQAALTAFGGEARLFRLTRDAQWGPLLVELASS